MRILVLYNAYTFKRRKTIDDHLYSFKRYVHGVDFYYLNVTLSSTIPRYLEKIPFDSIIFHYTFLSMRYADEQWKDFYSRNRRRLSKLKGYKVAIPQDEYNYTGSMWSLFADVGMDAVFTCAYSRDFEALYPSRLGLKHVETVYTGYIDDHTLDQIKRRGNDNNKRPIDVGYRARALPYWLGRHAQKKIEIADRVKVAINGKGFKTDIANTEGETRAFLGDEWFDYLLRCRTMLGCLGGSSLLDAFGGIAQKVTTFMKLHPEAKFEAVEEACFPGEDGKIEVFALSPRHFECAMTKTCQVLLEGDYNGVFIPDQHYIELKLDYSNMDEVVEKIADHGYCERIANNCYRDVVLSGRYSYRTFANTVISHITAAIEPRKTKNTVLAIGRLYIREHLNKFEIFRFAYFAGIIKGKLRSGVIVRSLIRGFALIIRDKYRRSILALLQCFPRRERERLTEWLWKLGRLNCSS